jgi:magnesium transporter
LGYNLRSRTDRGVKILEAKVYLFNAKGNDEQLDINDVRLDKIKENQLLWINVLGRDKEFIEKITEALELKNVPVKSILNVLERPRIDIYENFYRFFIVSVKTTENGQLKKIPIDFMVGKNYVITIHDEEVEYFKNYTELEKGETHIGELDAESFIAALLDLHLVTYFCVLEQIEEKVDWLDAKVLQTDIETNEFLAEMVKLRKTVSYLRRWFLPHREVFYALSRPDFQQVAQSDSAESFRLLTEHFENAFEAIESSRDTLLGLFDLYATKSAQTTNDLVKRLTLITLIVGLLGVIAGTFGMNFEVNEIFKAENGFWITVVVMLILASGLIVFAKLKRLI